LGRIRKRSHEGDESLTQTFTCTVVHAPGALPESSWQQLCRAAPGVSGHELRLVVLGAMNPSGPQLLHALGAWVRSVQIQDPQLPTEYLGARGVPWVAVLDRTSLQEHTASSPAIHSGMVIVLHPSSWHEPRATKERSSLQLCINAGLDSGRLFELRRGTHTLGRGTPHLGDANIRINDPHLRRSHAWIRVDDGNALLHTVDSPAQPIKADTHFALGRSHFHLVHEHPSPVADVPWPPPPEGVGEKVPEGRHRNLLLMSLAPLFVGIILVLATGMWIFLLFTAASVVIALITLVDAGRRRRQFRSATRASGELWAQRRRDALPSPGLSLRLLRARIRHPHPVDRQDGLSAAVVSVGEGMISPDLNFTGNSDTAAEEGRSFVRAPAAVTLIGGESTIIMGSPIDEASVLRWVLAQLARFGSTLLVVLQPQPNASPEQLLENLVHTMELRDYDAIRITSLSSLADAIDSYPPPSPSDPAPVVLSSVPLPARYKALALAARWHVIGPAGIGESSIGDTERSEASQLYGWHVDLEARELRRVDGGTSQLTASKLVPDGISRETLGVHLRLARGLLADYAGPTTLPREFSAGFPAQLMTQSAESALLTLLGCGLDGDQTLDIVNDGPHILIAGTSGSGKSELLKSMLLGWASRYGPEELNFFLFDFKGGSTFHQLTELRHSLGLITDLSLAQAERTLEGVQSEMKRRERVFLEAGASDYEDFRLLHPALPLARILVVIDEFRIFSHEMPSSMDELMRLATIGRSLGLHLILSTQRPQGVVTSDIRANIGTIISLRLRSEEESRELVGAPDAAHIPRQSPGRGVIRRPGESAAPFQTVQLQDQTINLTMQPEVAAFSPSQNPGTNTAELVSALNRYSEAHRRTRTHTPLCPPLPKVLVTPRQHSDILLGLLDDPSHQQQRRIQLELEGGFSAALIGEPESGGPSALRAVAQQLLNRPAEVHVYLLDGDHSLRDFRSHPRVGCWVADEHLAETTHLLARLEDAITHRRTSTTAKAVPLVLLMSGHSRWHVAGQSTAGGGLEHSLSTVISQGSGVGVSTVISGGRELSMGRLGSRIARKVYLPYGVPEDTRYLWPKLRSTDPLPGRGVLVAADDPPPGRVVQLVSNVTGPPPTQENLPWAPHEATPPGMIWVHPLPEEVKMPPIGAGPPIVGLTQFDHAQAMLDDAWQVSLILGAPGTGKTNALRVLAAQRPCMTVQDLTSSPKPEEHLSVDRTVLLVDDADRKRPEEHAQIETWLLAGGQVVATARPSVNVFSQLPWAHRARNGSANFILSPTNRSQGDAFGALIPVLSRPIPGRAAWLKPEGTCVIQWWLR